MNSLQQQQANFTAFIRDPLHQPMPSGVKPERMAMYAELIFNNVESFLSSNFPVIKTILTEPQWQALVRDFFIQHRSTTPYFVEIPEEFLGYLQDERQNPGDFPFLLELAHYEWVEMALSVAQETPTINPPINDLLNTCIQLSPLAWVLAYQYPVQQISPDYLPIDAPEQPTFLVIYRDQQDMVKFLGISLMTYQLLNLIQTQAGGVARDYLRQLQSAMPQYDLPTIVAGGEQVLAELFEKNIITA